MFEEPGRLLRDPYLLGELESSVDERRLPREEALAEIAQSVAYSRRVHKAQFSAEEVAVFKSLPYGRRKLAVAERAKQYKREIREDMLAEFRDAVRESEGYDEDGDTYDQEASRSHLRGLTKPMLQSRIAGLLATPTMQTDFSKLRFTTRPSVGWSQDEINKFFQLSDEAEEDDE